MSSETGSIQTRVASLQSEIASLDAAKAVKENEMKALCLLLPVEPNLKFFYGDSCPMTKKAEPYVQALEASLGKKVMRLEVYGNEKNVEEYKSCGGVTHCGGVPFFYNVMTKATVCGARETDVLKQWAKQNGPATHF